MDAPFLIRDATPDSRRLLELARVYVAALPQAEARAVCVCSSVAWGTATPTSDLDLQIVVGDGTTPQREKRLFEGEYVDHFEWPEAELETALSGWLDDPVAHPVGSYSFAYSLVLRDVSGRTTESRDRLRARLEDPDETRRWIDARWRQAEESRAALLQAAACGHHERAWELVWTCVQRLADAVLHEFPGGHCGQWPHQLRRCSALQGEDFYREALAFLAPHGIDGALLSSVIAPLERIHRQSAHPGAGGPLGASAVNAGYFGRKARFYLEGEDPLSLRVVLDRQLGYVRGNLRDMEDAGRRGDLAGELCALERALGLAWPEPRDWTTSTRALDRYIERIGALQASCS